jgi:hypothetical protein
MKVIYSHNFNHSKTDVQTSEVGEKFALVGMGP